MTTSTTLRRLGVAAVAVGTMAVGGPAVATSSTSVVDAAGSSPALHQVVRTASQIAQTAKSGGGGSGSAPFSMTDKFARQVTRFGDVDNGVYHIEHVRELQYRLTWAGVFDRRVNGRFGKATRAAVEAYQKQEGLPVTGVATHQTWAHLIHDTIRGRGAIPAICKTSGWHACYDRWRHQVTLWHDGGMINSWLVRGGESYAQTRVGNFQVFYRDKHHVSHLYDAPMPYAQFFSGGEALHGSVYMIDPFVDHSHGCINMYLKDARQLWHLTHDKTLDVSVYGAWS